MTTAWEDSQARTVIRAPANVSARKTRTATQMLAKNDDSKYIASRKAQDLR